jgi:hypothetical protein
MRRVAKFSACLLAATVVYVAPAYAQATRTWVSGVGDDVNPCSRTAPCKTFAGAISKTSAGGEINCLDPGGFGALTITKSITIDCAGTIGSTLASAVNGFNVNDSASGFPNTIRVILRNLSINGAQSAAQNAQGNPGTGLTGINFTSGASLIVENVIIQNFNAGSAVGINFRPAGTARLTVLNSVIANNGTGATGGGIVVQPTGASGNARVSLRNVLVAGNANNAMRIDSTGNTGTGIVVEVDGSEFSGSTTGISLITPGGTATAQLNLFNSTIANNASFGINANGPTVTARVGNTTITNSGTAVNITNSATVNTFGNNYVIGNSFNGTFTLPAINQQ